MTDEPDLPLDLSPLNADREARAARLSTRLVARVSAFMDE